LKEWQERGEIGFEEIKECFKKEIMDENVNVDLKLKIRNKILRYDCAREEVDSQKLKLIVGF
jgi:hypothetical protein